MIQKLKAMWNAFLNGLKMAKEAFRGKEIDIKSQEYTDISKPNFLAVASKTISNLACTEATFEVSSDSAQLDVLKLLCKDIEEHRFTISEGMLGQGDYYILPYFEKDSLKHCYLGSDRVRIVAENEVNFVLDYYQKNSGARTYFLIRNHKIVNDVLIVSYGIVNEQGNPDNINFEPWNSIIASSPIEYRGNINMGYGRYKSPTSSRGLSEIYGVPMNFGCSALEQDIFETLKQIKDEFRNGKSVIITDPRNLKFSDEEKQINLPENVLPIKSRQGMENELNIFNPTLRYSEHYEKLQEQLSELEYQMGLNNGIFTKNDAMTTATATAVKRSNSNTIAYINSVHNALDNGNRMTLEADAMYLNISPDLWHYNSDYIDPFADMSEQFGYLMQALNAGAVEVSDVTKWLYPQMSKEEIEEKLQRINDSKVSNTADAIYASLTQ